MSENRTDVYRIDYQAIGVENLEKSLRTLDGIDDVIKKLKKELSSTDINTQKFDALNRVVAETKTQRGAIIAQQKAFERALSQPIEVAEGSYRQLNTQLIQLRNRYKDLSQTTREGAVGQSILKDINILDIKLKGIDVSMGQFQRNVGNYRGEIISALSQISPQLGNLAGQISSITGQTGGLTALSGGSAAIGIAAAGFQKALTINAQISDLKSDVVKTANLSKDEIDGLVESLKQLDTRTGLQDLLKIAAIGGQFGIEGTQNVLKFTTSIDRLNVTIGDEFGGNVETVAKEIGGLSNILFGATKDGEKLEQNYLRLGNAINALSAEGSATAPVMTDFASRIGRIAKPLGITEGQILGLSATLQELNVNAEQGGTAVSHLLTSITSDRVNIAKTLGIDVKEFTELLNKDLFSALNLVISRVNQLSSNNTDLSDILKTLKIDGQGELSVFLALAENQKLLGARTSYATQKLKEQDSITNEFNEKNSNLAASLEKLSNTFAEGFVSSGFERSMTKVIDFLTTATDEAFKFIDLFGIIVNPISVFDKAIALSNKKSIQTTINAQNLSNQLRQGINPFETFQQTLQSKQLPNNALNLTAGSFRDVFALNNTGKSIENKAKGTLNLSNDKNNHKKDTKRNPSVQAAKDVADELARIEKESTERIMQIRKEAAKSRVAAIVDDYAREIETENARLGERLIVIREAGQKIEHEAIERAEKLKGKEGVTQKQIDAILAKGKSERLEIEQQSNQLYQLEFEQHHVKIAEIDGKYHIKALERLEKQANDRSKNLHTSLDKELIDIENAAIEAQRVNEKARRAALIGKSDDEKRNINFNFDNQSSDINRGRLQKRLETLQSVAGSIAIANAASNRTGQGNVFDPSVLNNLYEQINSTEKQITEAIIIENERREKSDAETTERRLDRQRDLRDKMTQIAFDGGQNVVSNVLQLETIELETQTQKRISTVEKEYDAKLKAAQGNVVLTTQLEKELQDKRNSIEADAIRERAEINKTQALIDAGLSIIKTFSSVPFPASILASAFVGLQTTQQISIINAQTDQQLAALKGEQGLVVPLSQGRFEIGKDITGKRHTTGGEFAFLNGQLVEAEQGERLDKDENGNIYVINRRSTEAFRKRLDKIAGQRFKGKGAELSAINMAKGGIPLAAQGFSSALPGASAVNVSKFEVTLSNEAVNFLAETISTRTGIAVKTGVIEGTDTSNRSTERQKLAVQNAIL